LQHRRFFVRAKHAACIFSARIFSEKRFTLQITTTPPICHQLCFDLFKLPNQNS